MKIVECKTCKGRGWVRDKTVMMLATMSILLIPVALASDTEDGLGNKRCERCKGEGYRKLKL